MWYLCFDFCSLLAWLGYALPLNYYKGAVVSGKFSCVVIGVKESKPSYENY